MTTVSESIAASKGLGNGFVQSLAGARYTEPHALGIVSKKLSRAYLNADVSELEPLEVECSDTHIYRGVIIFPFEDQPNPSMIQYGYAGTTSPWMTAQLVDVTWEGIGSTVDLYQLTEGNKSVSGSVVAATNKLVATGGMYFYNPITGVKKSGYNQTSANVFYDHDGDLVGSAPIAPTITTHEYYIRAYATTEMLFSIDFSGKAYINNSIDSIIVSVGDPEDEGTDYYYEEEFEMPTETTPTTYSPDTVERSVLVRPGTTTLKIETTGSRKHLKTARQFRLQMSAESYSAPYDLPALLENLISDPPSYEDMDPYYFFRAHPGGYWVESVATFEGAYKYSSGNWNRFGYPDPDQFDDGSQQKNVWRWTNGTDTGPSLPDTDNTIITGDWYQSKPDYGIECTVTIHD